MTQEGRGGGRRRTFELTEADSSPQRPSIDHSMSLTSCSSECRLLEDENVNRWRETISVKWWGPRTRDGKLTVSWIGFCSHVSLWSKGGGCHGVTSPVRVWLFPVTMVSPSQVRRLSHMKQSQMSSTDFISWRSRDFFSQGLCLATGLQRLDRFHRALSLINSVSLSEICRDIPQHHYHPPPSSSSFLFGSLHQTEHMAGTQSEIVVTVALGIELWHCCCSSNYCIS